MERINSSVLLLHFKMKCEFYLSLEFWNRRLVHNVCWCIARHFVFDYLTLEKFGIYTVWEWKHTCNISSLPKTFLEHNSIELKCSGAQVFFSLFLSFSLFFSQKHTLPTFISYPHPMPALFWVNCNCIPTVFERWQVADLDNWVSAWNNCKERVFLRANKRKGEKKRKREKNASTPGHSSWIKLCSKIFSFLSFSLFLSLHTFNILSQPKKTLSSHLLHALTQLSRSATFQLFLKGGWSGLLGKCMK